MPLNNDNEQVTLLTEERKEMLRCIYRHCRKWQDFLAAQVRKYKIKRRHLMAEGHFNYNTLNRLENGILSPEPMLRIRLSIMNILRYRDNEENLPRRHPHESVESQANEFAWQCFRLENEQTCQENEQLIEALAAFSKEQRKGSLYDKAEILYLLETKAVDGLSDE